MIDKLRNRVENNKLLVIILLAILVLVLFLIAGLYTRAYLIPKVEEASITSVNVSTCGYYTMEENSSSIDLVKAYPISDTAGMKMSGYSFSLENTCSQSTDINIYLVVTSDSTIPASYVKYSFNSAPNFVNSMATYTFSTKTNSQFQTKTSKTVSQVYLLKSDTIASGDVKNYNLKLWIDSTTGNEYQNKKFGATVVVGDSSSATAATAS